jgi:hypothetical protein
VQIRLAAAAAVVLAGVLTPSAEAAGIVVDRPCYREGTQAKVLGTGFQPGQPVAVTLDGQQIVTQAADAAGQVGGLLLMSSMSRSEQFRSLRMAQVTNQALNTTVSLREIQLYVVTKPRRFRPGRRLRVRAGGFYGVGGTLYDHIRGPKKRNLRIGRVKGPCGKVSATRKVLLKRGDPPGFYVMQFDTRRGYTGSAAPLRVRKAYSISRIFKFSRTSSFATSPLGLPSAWAPLP